MESVNTRLNNDDDDTKKEIDGNFFKLIEKTNEYLRKIQPEIQLVHKVARDLYLHRFEELESIILNPVDFAKVILVIGNETKIENAQQKLSWLSNSAILSITVAFSATRGTTLSQTSFEKVKEACNQIVFLDIQRQSLIRFLETRMHLIAPNTMALVGPQICAKLIASAGGIKELSRTPAGNIQVLGSQRKSLHAQSMATAKLHRGHLGDSPMVLHAPPHDQIKLVRMLATKTALSSRVDVCGTHPDGQYGEDLKKQIMGRYERVSAPG